MGYAHGLEISTHDQVFARLSYLHEPASHPAPLGPILDGGSYGDTGNIKALGENFALSETHDFNSNLINEFRFGYNFGHFSDVQTGANTDVASQVGLGGIPYAPLNGGLPFTSVAGVTSFGAPELYAANEYENVSQISDSVTKVVGNHTLEGGVSIQHIRFYTLAPTASRGKYDVGIPLARLRHSTPCRGEPQDGSDRTRCTRQPWLDTWSTS